MEKVSDQLSAIANEKNQLILLSKKHEQILSLKPDVLMQTAETMDCAIYQFTPTLDKILYLNPVIETYWGQTREALYKNPEAWFDCIHPDDRLMVKNALTQLSTSKSPETHFQYRLKKPDGSICYLQSRCIFVKDENNPLGYLLGTTIDMSSYIRAQQGHFINEQILALYHLENADDVILNSILKVICQSLDWDEGEIWVYNHTDESLYCVSLWHRLGRDITPFYDITYHMVVKAGVGFSDRVINANSPVLENNFGERSAYYRSQMAKKVGLNTAIGIPIAFKGKLIGVLNFFNRTTKNPSTKDIEILQKTADLIGTIIQEILKRDHPDSFSHQDDLTGLSNRTGFELLISTCIENIDSNEKLAVIMLELDKFNSIIESNGLEVGNILLKQLSFKFIQALGHQAKCIAHIDANIYGFIFDNLQNIEMLRPLLDNISAILQKPFIIKDQNIHVKASMGVSIFPDDGSDMATILKNAEIALKKAESFGGNTIQLYNKNFEKKLMDAVQTESALRFALAENQFELLYQPRVDLKSSKITGIETSIIWHDSLHGLRLQNSFLRVMEESNLAVYIDEWSLLNITNYFSLINLKIPVSIRLSERQFNKPKSFLTLINELIEKFSINPTLLQIEINEKAFMTHTKDVLNVLTELKAKGISIILNEFGTKFSSFDYLQQLHPSQVKIDKSFIRKIPHDTNSMPIVQTIIELCHTLGIKVVAEDVETAEQVEFLIQKGCDQAQGSYFFKPLSLYELKALIERDAHLLNDT